VEVVRQDKTVSETVEQVVGDNLSSEQLEQFIKDASEEDLNEFLAGISVYVNPEDVSIEELSEAETIEYLGYEPIAGLERELDINPAIERAIINLPMQLRQTIILRFGFDGPEFTFAEIGWLFNMSAQRVQMVQTYAIERLRCSPAIDELSGLYGPKER
jgi:DNA-directed RNA polymerase sigma subunit (sigma70/sigma32)